MSKDEIKDETKGEPMVDIGIVPYDVNDNLNKFLYISLNGKTIMLERGRRHKVPASFAEVYSHRVKMAGRRMDERARREKELRQKQTQEGVKFM